MIHVDNLAEIQQTLGPSAVIYNYNPIPIHGIENDTDNVLLNMDPVNCPIAAPIRAALLETKLMKHYNELFSQCLYPDLNKVFGIPLSALDTSTVYSFGDEIVASEYEHPEFKYPLSDCAREQLYDAMDIGIYDQIFGSDLLTRLASTLFFQRVVSDFDMVVQFEANKAEIIAEINEIEEMLETEEYDQATGERLKNLKTDAEEKRRKFIYYSAHDTTVGAFLSGMLNKQSEFPPFASQLLYEFHKDSSTNMGPEGYYVRITYNDEIIRIPNICKNAPTCDYATFKRFLQGRMFQGDVIEECNKTEVDWHYMYDDTYTVMIAAALVLVALAAIMMKIVMKQSRREEKQFYITSN